MLSELRKDLRHIADKKKAVVLRRFFKTGKGQYGEGDIFLGVTVPKQRALVRKYWRDVSLKDLDKLITSKVHEERLIALFILVKQYEHAGAGLRSKIFRFYLKHAKHINNWDLVDMSAPNIVGAYIFEYRDGGTTILNKLARSSELWERRISILATFYFIRKGHPDHTLKLAKILLADKHDLIHKAVGWMLREAGKRCGEKTLTAFLDAHYKKMPRTMLRYAVERLPERKRRHYLDS